jgi:ATP-dependent Clp protease ATP-binding subunit ClpA
MILRMFERFSDRARTVVVVAQHEARAMGHDHIGTEHVLLGLLQAKDGLAAHAMKALGVEFEPVRGQIVRIVGTGEGPSPAQIPFTPRAQEILELAPREAMALNQDVVETEHILLALVGEDSDVASQVLLEFGADATRVRATVSDLLAGGGMEAVWRARRGVRRWFRPLRLDAERQAGAEGREPDGGDLLLALTGDPDGVAARALTALGVDRQRLGEEVVRARRPRQ